MWRAFQEETHSINKKIMDDQLAKGRKLVMETVKAGNKDIVLGFDGCHNHVKEATCGGAAYVGLSPASIAGVIVEAGVLSKKLTKHDRETLNMEENHFSETRSSKGMESELAEKLANDAALHKLWVRFMCTDRDSAAWTRMSPGLKKIQEHFEKYYPNEDWGEIFRLLCIGHDLVNFEKELTKQANNQSQMLQRNLCAENVGGTCGSSVIQGKKKGTKAKGKRKRCNKMTPLLAKSMKRAAVYLCYEELTPENCPTLEAIEAMRPTIGIRCKEMLEHFTSYDVQEHPELKGRRLTCFAGIAAAAAAVDKFVVQRVTQHCAPGAGAIGTPRLEGLWAQILKRAPKSDNLLGIESVNAFQIAIAFNSEIPLCKYKKSKKEWDEAIYVSLARAYEARLGLGEHTLLSEAGATRVRAKLQTRVADSVRRGKPEYREKRSRAKRKGFNDKRAAKQDAKDSKGYKSAGAVAGNWTGTDLEAAAAAPSSKAPKVCEDCGGAGHLSGRAGKSCTAAGIAKYAARKQEKDAQKTAGEKKKVKKVEKGQEVVGWCDLWGLTKKINAAIKMDPTVYPESDSDSNSEDDENGD